jgi:hypothetical protein
MSLPKISKIRTLIVISVSVILSVCFVAIQPPEDVIALEVEHSSVPMVGATQSPKEESIKIADAKHLEEIHRISELPLIENPKSNKETIWNFLLNEGFSAKQAAGIMGNIYQENKYRTDCDGIVAWAGSRQTKLQQMPGDYTTLEVQLKFLMKELNGDYKSVKKHLKKCSTIDEAEQVFEREFEKPGIPMTATRQKEAHKVYDLYTK